MAAEAGAAIVEKARELGADAAGIATVELLKRSPSHRLLARFGTKIDGEYSWDAVRDVRQIDWPAGAGSALVIAASHPRDVPELDWSCPSGTTPGTQLLVGIAEQLSGWIEGTLGVGTRRMPYWVEEGGVYVKDAAVLAGLGCIGRNNLLVGPDHGPRIRLRVILMDAELTPTGPIAFDPCHDCDEPCRRACPQHAFENVVLTTAEAAIDVLPGRDGTFGRARCFAQMSRDLEDSGVDVGDSFMSEFQLSRHKAKAEFEAEGRIKWCRRCELACPVGS